MRAWIEHDWLSLRAGTRGDGPALVFADNGEVWTWRQLGERAAAVAASLRGAGVAAGARVLVGAASARDSAPALFGTWMAGACAVPVHPRWTAVELQHAIDVTSPVAVIGEPPMGWQGAVVQPGGRGTVEVPGAAPDVFPVDDRWLAEFARWKREGSGCEQPMLAVMTSGTTGASKAAVLPKRAVLASAAASALRLDVQAEDRWLACMPLSHVGGAMILLRSVLYGTAVVATDGFDASTLAATARRFDASLLSVVPTMLTRLLDADDARPPASLRATLVGGAAASAALLSRAEQAGWHPRATWGLSEAASQVCTTLCGAAPGRGDVGPPLPGTEVRVVEPGADGVGELVVRGPTLMSGYLGAPRATARAMRDGWLHTGDLGRIEGGRVVVVARRTDLVVTGGENVYPAEVEAAIGALRGVSEVAVVGLPDETWGQVVVACVRFDDGVSLSLDALRDGLRDRLGGFKLPRRLVRLDQPLPRNASGKVDRAALRRVLEGGAPTA